MIVKELDKYLNVVSGQNKGENSESSDVTCTY